MSRGDEDRRAYEKRAQDLRDRINAGESFDEVLEDRQLQRGRELMDRVAREEQESLEREDRRSRS